MKIKSVLFDLDGTLLNSINTIYHSVLKSTRELNLPPLTKRQIKDNVHTSVESAFLKCYPEHSDKLESAKECFNRNYMRNFMKMTKEVPGAVNTLRRLRSRGVKIGIVTSKTKSVAKKILKYFKIPYDILLAREDTINGRPDPEPLKAAMNFLHSMPTETIYVGDTPQDIKQGKNAQVTTIGVVSGVYSKRELRTENPDFIVDSVTDIDEIVDF